MLRLAYNIVLIQVSHSTLRHDNTGASARTNRRTHSRGDRDQHIGQSRLRASTRCYVRITSRSGSASLSDSLAEAPLALAGPVTVLP